MIVNPALVIIAYLLGSVSTAIVVCRFLDKADPREIGSRNPGATNVLRYAGRAAAIATLAGDIAKGTLPILAAQLIGMAPPILTLVGLAAFLGHLYPIYYNFRGGKGVATFLGVNLALDPWIGLTFVTIWASMALVTRYSSVAALTAATTVPLLAVWLEKSTTSVIFLAIMVTLVFWRHRMNISSLIDGTEKKIGQKD